MAWIKTVPLVEASEQFLQLLQQQRQLYPVEYAEPVQHAGGNIPGELPGIIASHTLMPQALYHAFSAFGAMMAPDLPLTRREHELITTVVSVTNRCRY